MDPNLDKDQLDYISPIMWATSWGEYMWGIHILRIRLYSWRVGSKCATVTGLKPAALLRNISFHLFVYTSSLN